MANPLKAFVMAAGRGQRMRPLTDTLPKPMLAVRGKPLIQWLLEALHANGCSNVVINTNWLGEKLVDHFGVSPRMGGLDGLRVQYSREDLDFGHALETAGGIARALPLLGDAFWVTAGDVFAPDFCFPLSAVERFLQGDGLAHIWLVPNPSHHPLGDFGLDESGTVTNQAPVRYTYSTIGLYRASFFDVLPAGNPAGLVVPLAPMLRKAVDNRRVSGEVFAGDWTDVGTPERLTQINLTTP